MFLNNIFNIMFRWCSVAAVMLMTGIVPSLAAEPDDTAHINPATVDARGKQPALLTLKALGCYAITAFSAQGVALQSLDRGKYKTLTHASSKSKWLQSKGAGSDLFIGSTKHVTLYPPWCMHYQRAHTTTSAYAPPFPASLPSRRQERS